MNQKKSWFSFSLWKEGMHQAKGITLLFSFFAAAYGILSHVTIWMTLSDAELAKIQAGTSQYYPVLKTMPWVQPFYFFSFCILTPILCLLLFRFLNSRKESDFYHSIPETRLCLFTSFFAAVMSSVLFYLVVCCLSVVLPSLFLPKIFLIDWNGLLRYVGIMFVASLYVGGMVTIAMSVTGTIFSNLVVSGLLIFAPKLLSMCLVNIVADSIPFVIVNPSNPLWSNQYNIVHGLVIGLLFGGRSLQAVLHSHTALLYTLAAGILAAGAGAFFFQIRPSEAAGKAAPSRKIQAVYRLFVTFIASLLPVSIIYQAIVNHDAFDRVSVYYLFLCYLIVLAVFYIFELLMTRTWKNLLRILPSFLIIPLVNGLLLFGMVTSQKSMVNFTPNPEEIKEIYLIASSRFDYPNGVYAYDYYGFQEQKLPITNPEILEILSRNLKAETESYRADLLAGEEEFQGGYYQYLSTHNNILKVELHTGKGNASRNIAMNERDYFRLQNLLSENPDRKNIYSSLPSAEADGFTLQVDNQEISIYSELGTAYYEALRQDMEAMGAENWYSYLYGSSGEQSKYPIADINITLTEFGKPLYLSVPISSATPRTARVYVDHLEDPTQVLSDLPILLSRMKDGELNYLQFTFDLTDVQSGEIFYLYQWFDPYMAGAEENIPSESNQAVSEDKEVTAADNSLFWEKGDAYAKMHSLLAELEKNCQISVVDCRYLLTISAQWSETADPYYGDHQTPEALIGLDKLPSLLKEWLLSEYPHVAPVDLS